MEDGNYDTNTQIMVIITETDWVSRCFILTVLKSKSCLGVSQWVQLYVFYTTVRSYSQYNQQKIRLVRHKMVHGHPSTWWKLWPKEMVQISKFNKNKSPPKSHLRSVSNIHQPLLLLFWYDPIEKTINEMLFCNNSVLKCS